MTPRGLRGFKLLAVLVILLAACGGAREAPTPEGADTAAEAPLPAPAATAPLASPGSAPTVAPTPLGTAPGTVALEESFSGQRAFEHVVALAEGIGARVAGTASEERAADYIARRLAAYGYQVERQPFSFRAVLAAIHIPSPELTSLGAAAMRGSAGGEVEGRLVDVGLGRRDEIPPGGLRGRIALASRGSITFTVKGANAAEAGAAALIVSNNEPGLFLGELSGRSSIPVVGIDREDGQRLREMLGRGPVVARLRVDASDRTSHNVLGRPPGQSCRVLMGGHYDSVPWGPGANDNASGTAVVLEIARLAAPKSQRLGACFAAFGAEEDGLHGSRYMVANLTPEDRASLKAMINLDMVGVGDRWRLGGSFELIETGLREARGLGIEASGFQLPLGQGSDHQSFIRAGIPALFIHFVDDPRYHTLEDQPHYVQPEAMAEAGRLGLRLLELLGAP